MNEQIKMQKAKDVYDAFKQGNISRIIGELAPTVDWWVAGPSDIVPYAGKRHGGAAVRQFFADLDRHETVIEYSPREFIAEGDHVIVTGHHRARVKTTGKMYDSEWVHIFMFEGDRISSFREYSDTANVVAAYRRP